MIVANLSVMDGMRNGMYGNHTLLLWPVRDSCTLGAMDASGGCVRKLIKYSQFSRSDSDDDVFAYVLLDDH